MAENFHYSDISDHRWILGSNPELNAETAIFHQWEELENPDRSRIFASLPDKANTSAQGSSSPIQMSISGWMPPAGSASTDPPLPSRT